MALQGVIREKMRTDKTTKQLQVTIFPSPAREGHIRNPTKKKTEQGIGGNGRAYGFKGYLSGPWLFMAAGKVRGWEEGRNREKVKKRVLRTTASGDRVGGALGKKTKSEWWGGGRLSEK